MPARAAISGQQVSQSAAGQMTQLTITEIRYPIRRPGPQTRVHCKADSPAPPRPHMWPHYSPLSRPSAHDSSTCQWVTSSTGKQWRHDVIWHYKYLTPRIMMQSRSSWQRKCNSWLQITLTRLLVNKHYSAASSWKKCNVLCQCHAGRNRVRRWATVG